ncbi:cytochrome c oxidase subunit II [Henriciella mobilis]|uniref:Cytochrome c oxidase subunit 2 n=1 Tax=Henriciella mobilis TaxID=2305467 RepID=A0A399RB61_9PROT|nr:cytochrome c oxidase subunit II [Henriciella mobilis]RIJ15542.1 cytochrome c oxidase subunit II [Henriciella mobilis]RIJ19006.1 cytochrome c oxidase subunit II [Henriciella mobilis]RIJ28003.1 cytochrome c oxidase subunit II [Henriciella mobilis]
MRFLVTLLSFFGFSAAAFAAEPVNGALNFQPAATRIMERLHGFHTYLLVIITLITIFVLALLIVVMVRYNKRANPVPRKFSHNTAIEIIWTVVPVLILVAIAGPSFSNLFYQENEPDLEVIAQSSDDNPNIYPDAAAEGWVTVKAQGNQWNWTYSFPDELDDGGYPVEFVSNPLQRGLSSDQDLEGARGPRNLTVDYPLVLPVNRYIRYQTAASDVIHSFAMPAFGIKTDAVPGRLNEGWFLVEEEGTYYGQCSELCGKDHAFMPIEIRVVSADVYDAWISSLKAGEFDAAFEALPARQQTVSTDVPTDASMRLAQAQ